MGTKYEITMLVRVSLDNSAEAHDAFDYFVDKLYDDPNTSYHVNSISQQGGVIAYDTETGEDL